VFIARISFQPQDATERRIAFGIVHGVDERGIPNADATIEILASHPFGELESTGQHVALTDARLLPPIIPTKIIGIGKNYADHASEMGGEVPVEPIIFLKPTTALIGSGDDIILPSADRRVDHEVELAVIMGRLAKDISAEKALDYVFGYTVANDVSDRHLQKLDGQWTRAKGFDTFLPMGPWIRTDIAPGNLRLTAEINDDLTQDGNTRDLVKGVAELVAFCSSVMTLVPGDIILTGTPAGVSQIRPGDVVTCAIEGIGELINPVA
jgi:2-keto-4-pentenoate hydratase/2-oxohepta-3-ene-1,7-dioic acid hydratase in catechol pathway